MRSRPVVALDGPAGAGKSTAARLLAEKARFQLVDTGALYRCVALAARNALIPWSDASALESLTKSLVERRAIRLHETGEVSLDGKNVSQEIRTPDLSMGASSVSAIPEVRRGLLAMQRQLGEAGGVVLEGRDIGTVVFPDAEIKYFVTASPEVRAQRRWEELQAQGVHVPLGEVLQQIVERDHADATRAIAPLTQAPDAELLDTSALSLHEVVDRMATRVQAWRPRELG